MRFREIGAKVRNAAELDDLTTLGALLAGHVLALLRRAGHDAVEHHGRCRVQHVDPRVGVDAADVGLVFSNGGCVHNWGFAVLQLGRMTFRRFRRGSGEEVRR